LRKLKECEGSLLGDLELGKNCEPLRDDEGNALEIIREGRGKNNVNKKAQK
jgi:hypothetical protein